MDWVEKYRPEHIRDIVGNTQVLSRMLAWARSWSPGTRPLLLYGKPGTGKTSSAHALARDMGWEIIELNASDQRTRAVLERVAGASARMSSLSGTGRRLILLDEVDNLHGTADRGGAKAIIEIIRTAAQPIVLIANNLQEIPSELKGVCEPLLFRAPQVRSIANRLKAICASEGVRCSDELLRTLAERANGDVRAAVTMLHAASMGEREVREGDLAVSAKDERATIFDLVNAVFGVTEDEHLLRSAMESGEEPDRIQEWLEEAVFHMKDTEAIASAYRSLAHADMFLGRTMKRQYYQLWRYAQAISLIGVSAAAGGRGIHERIVPPQRRGKVFAMQRQRATRIRVLKRISERAHLPLDALKEEYIAPIAMLVERDPFPLMREFTFDADDLTYLIRNRSRAAEIYRQFTEMERSERAPADADAEREGGRKPDRKSTQKQTTQKQTTLF